MSAIILASHSTDLARRVRAATMEDLLVIRPEQLPALPAQVMAMANGSGPVTSVLVDPDEREVSHVFDLARRFQTQHPEVGVLLVTERLQELGLPALRAGVKDLIHTEAGIEDIRVALHRVRPSNGSDDQSRGASAQASTTRVVTIASPKGGVGKTTVATNVAVGLAAEGDQSAVLVDLDIQFGDVAAALDLNPEYTIGDVVMGAGLSDPMALKTLLTRHESGLHVLTGVRTPAEADAITAGHVSQILDLLRTQFRYVVIDTAPGLSEQTLAALDRTTDLVLVTSQDVPGIRGLRKELELLDALDLAPATRHVVVNFSDRSGGLTLGDVEKTINRRVDVVLPRHKTVPRSTNQGVPLLAKDGRTPLSKPLKELVSRFAPAVTHFGRAGSRHGGSAR